MIKAKYIGPNPRLVGHEALVSRAEHDTLWVQFDEYDLDPDVEYALGQHAFPREVFEIVFDSEEVDWA